MKPPKNLNMYTDSETAAKGLEAVAELIRRGGKERVLWHLQVRFWDECWLNKGYTPACEYIVASMSYTNSKQP